MVTFLQSSNDDINVSSSTAPAAPPTGGSSFDYKFRIKFSQKRQQTHTHNDSDLLGNALNMLLVNIVNAFWKVPWIIEYQRHFYMIGGENARKFRVSS